MIEVVLIVTYSCFSLYCIMKRSRAPSALASQTTTTTTVVKKPKASQRSQFRIPRWVGRTNVGFPKELRMKHRYVQEGAFSSLNGAIHVNTYSCNGMYDPDVTGTGHQPQYFDQLTAIYQHYTVVASKITVQCSPRTTNSLPVMAVVYINDDTSVPYTSTQNAAEVSSSVYSLIFPNSNSVRLTKKWRASQNFGPGVVSDPNLQGTATGNPTEQQYYTLIVSAPTGTASTERLDVIVTIEYEAIWQELREIATS